MYDVGYAILRELLHEKPHRCDADCRAEKLHCFSILQLTFSNEVKQFRHNKHFQGRSVLLVSIIHIFIYYSGVPILLDQASNFTKSG